MPLCEDQFLRPYAFYLSVCKVIKFEPIRTKLVAGVLHFDGARHFIAWRLRLRTSARRAVFPIKGQNATLVINSWLQSLFEGVSAEKKKKKHHNIWDLLIFVVNKYCVRGATHLLSLLTAPKLLHLIKNKQRFTWTEQNTQLLLLFFIYSLCDCELPGLQSSSFGEVVSVRKTCENMAITEVLQIPQIRLDTWQSVLLQLLTLFPPKAWHDIDLLKNIYIFFYTLIWISN